MEFFSADLNDFLIDDTLRTFSAFTNDYIFVTWITMDLFIDFKEFHCRVKLTIAKLKFYFFQKM